MNEIPSHLHRRRRQISPKALASLRREIDRHLAKGRDMATISGWLDLPMSQLSEIIAKTGGIKT